MEFSRPGSKEEAASLKSDDPEGVFLAGGTDIMVGINYGFSSPDHVIGLSRVGELADYASRRIGAGVTWSRLENSTYATHEALAQAARSVGSPQIRAAGTLGGNIGTASPAGDGLTWLAASDAKIEVYSESRGTRLIPWSEFFTGVKKNSLGADEVIVAVVLPDDVPPRQQFGKVGRRNAMVISTVSACVMAADDGSVQVALGSVAPTPIRAYRAEELISGESSPSDSLLKEFEATVSQEVMPITDHRSTEEYRRHASGVLARRLLERCLGT